MANHRRRSLHRNGSYKHTQHFHRQKRRYEITGSFKCLTRAAEFLLPVIFQLFSGYLQNETMRERILNFIKIIDLGIQDIAVEENFIDNLSDSTTIPNDPLLKKIVGGISEAMSLALVYIQSLPLN